MMHECSTCHYLFSSALLHHAALDGYWLPLTRCMFHSWVAECPVQAAMMLYSWSTQGVLWWPLMFYLPRFLPPGLYVLHTQLFFISLSILCFQVTTVMASTPSLYSRGVTFRIRDDETTITSWTTCSCKYPFMHHDNKRYNALKHTFAALLTVILHFLFFLVYFYFAHL